MLHVSWCNISEISFKLLKILQLIFSVSIVIHSPLAWHLLAGDYSQQRICGKFLCHSLFLMRFSPFPFSLPPKSKRGTLFLLLGP